MRHSIARVSTRGNATDYRFQTWNSRIESVWCRHFLYFFTMTPKGKHPISVCMGTACYVRGSEKLLEEFKRVLGIEVGDTTPDGKFSLDCLRCVGACGLAPVVMTARRYMVDYNR